MAETLLSVENGKDKLLVKQLKKGTFISCLDDDGHGFELTLGKKTVKEIQSAFQGIEASKVPLNEYVTMELGEVEKDSLTRKVTFAHQYWRKEFVLNDDQVLIP